METPWEASIDHIDMFGDKKALDAQGIWNFPYVDRPELPVCKDPRCFYGVNGHILNKALFIETNVTPAIKPVFTLKNFSYRGLPSLKKIFMDYEDPLEYTFAVNVFGSFELWERLARSSTLRILVRTWRRELSLRLQSKAVDVVRNIATQSESVSNALQAAKFLADRGWCPKESKGRGRPSNEELEGIKKQEASKQSIFDEDAARVLGQTPEAVKTPTVDQPLYFNPNKVN